MGSIVQRL